MNILVLHGVNLNMFGQRDATHYGQATLADIDAALQALAAEGKIDRSKYAEAVEKYQLDDVHAGTTGVAGGDA